MPMHMRVPFVALVSAGWIVVLSSMRGNAALGEDELEAAAAAAAGEQGVPQTVLPEELSAGRSAAAATER